MYNEGIRSGYVIGKPDTPVAAVIGGKVCPESFVNGSTPIENQGRYEKFESIEKMKTYENENANGRFSEGGLFDRPFWRNILEM